MAERKWELEHRLDQAAIDFCRAHDEKLNPWELEFLESVENRNLLGSLTPRQKGTLAKLARTLGFTERHAREIRGRT